MTETTVVAIRELAATIQREKPFGACCLTCEWHKRCERFENVTDKSGCHLYLHGCPVSCKEN
jgi:hypothetical protein